MSVVLERKTSSEVEANPLDIGKPLTFSLVQMYDLLLLKQAGTLVLTGSQADRVIVVMDPYLHGGQLAVIEPYRGLALEALNDSATTVSSLTVSSSTTNGAPNDTSIGSSVRLLERAQELLDEGAQNYQDKIPEGTFEHLREFVLRTWELVPSFAGVLFSEAFLTATSAGDYQIEWEANNFYLELVVTSSGDVEYLWQDDTRESEGTVGRDEAVMLLLQTWGARRHGLRASA